ncbi:LamG domain-containing protein [Candidatus Poribacteria bacterium]|nr:LamG domain-containing protein [Candidatus Poribacteria bacterium]
MQIRISRFCLATACVAIAMFVVAGTSHAVIDPATAVGIWLMDEGKGNDVADLSAMKLASKLEGGTKWVDGKFDKAIEFDGKSGRMTTPDHENPADAITVSVWAKSLLPAWNNHGFLVEKRDAYILHPNQGGTLVAFPVCNGGCWNKPNSWDTGAIGPKDITQWHMYTGTFDSKTGEWIIYIDAEPASKLNLDKAKITVEKGPVHIGYDECCGGRFGSVVIDEVAIFNIALKQADIKSLYEKGIHMAVLAVESKDKAAAKWGELKLDR